MAREMPTPAQRKRLFDIEIDEVSVVDKPANQYGRIAFSKAGGPEEAPMPEIYDEQGQPVDESELEIGDLVEDEDGMVYEVVEDDGEDDIEDADTEKQLAEVGKFDYRGVGLAARRGYQAGRAGVRNTPGARAAVVGDKFLEPSSIKHVERATVAGMHVGRRRNRYLIGAGGAGVAGTGGIAYGSASKSLGDEVLEKLSKAVSDEDRDQIIAKAMNEVQVSKRETEEVRKELERLQDERVTEAFIAKAAEYNLPVDPGVLGPILKHAAEVLSDSELDVLDKVFSSVGDALYDEIGYVGGGDNASVVDTVDALATELVGKSSGRLTHEQAYTAAMAANPAVYDAYLAENGR